VLKNKLCKNDVSLEKIVTSQTELTSGKRKGERERACVRGEDRRRERGREEAREGVILREEKICERREKRERERERAWWEKADSVTRY
jgi:hypothetical protein